MDDDKLSGMRNDAYDEAQQRLREHPGYIEHLRIQAFATTLAEVFDPNWRELVALLDEVATNPELAVEMVQNVRAPDVRNRTSAINRLLHNYVASVMTLVDHSRRLMSWRVGPITVEYERRKNEMLQHPEIVFVQGLRNFSLHRSLPLLGHTLQLTPAGIESSEVELSVANLLQGDRWSAATKAFLISHGDAIPLRPIIRQHHSLVYSLNTWLVEQLLQANAAAVAEANELVVAVNAALMGGVDMETARRRTDEEDARHRGW